MNDTAVKEEHKTDILGVDIDNVTQWFESHVPGIQSPLSFHAISGGLSNLTYKVTDTAGNAFIFRRPPAGDFKAGAHDVKREYRIFDALKDTAVPVPNMVGLCTDHSVTGADFYVMHFVRANVLNNVEDAERVLDQAGRRKAGFELVDKLVALQNVDPDDVGLGDLSKREDFIARQLKRWKGLFDKANGGENYPQVAEIHDQLLAHIPEQKEIVLTHGDYRLENVMLSDQGEVQVVLDWEVCTLGDPLADMAYILTFWPHPDHQYPTRPGPTLAPGFPNQDELLAYYAEKSGRDMADFKYHLAFQYWRMAAVVVNGLAKYDSGVYQQEEEHPSLKALREALGAYIFHADELMQEVVAEKE